MDTNNSIIKNSNVEPKLYDNYKKSINEYIEGLTKKVNSSKFNSNENSIDIVKQKRIYLNTYIIPLLYLINSYTYQRYLDTKNIVVNNILINDQIDYYFNYYFDYRIPIIKSFNISIYRNYFKNNSTSENISENESKSNKINSTKIKLIINHLTNINKDIKKLSDPYKIKQDIDKIRKEFHKNTGHNNNVTMNTIYDKIFDKIKEDPFNPEGLTFIEALKKIQKDYNTLSGGAKNFKDDKIKNKFKDAIDTYLKKSSISINTNSIDQLKTRDIKTMIDNFLYIIKKNNDNIRGLRNIKELNNEKKKIVDSITKIEINKDKKKNKINENEKNIKILRDNIKSIDTAISKNTSVIETITKSINSYTTLGNKEIQGEKNRITEIEKIIIDLNEKIKTIQLSINALTNKNKNKKEKETKEKEIKENKISNFEIEIKKINTKIEEDNNKKKTIEVLKKDKNKKEKETKEKETEKKKIEIEIDQIIANIKIFTNIKSNITPTNIEKKKKDIIEKEIEITQLRKKIGNINNLTIPEVISKIEKYNITDKIKMSEHQNNIISKEKYKYRYGKNYAKRGGETISSTYDKISYKALDDISNNIEDIIENLNIYIEKKNSNQSSISNSLVESLKSKLITPTGDLSSDLDDFDKLYYNNIINTLKKIFRLLTIIFPPTDKGNNIHKGNIETIDTIKTTKIELSKNFNSVKKKIDMDIFDKKKIYTKLISEYNIQITEIDKKNMKLKIDKKVLETEINEEQATVKLISKLTIDLNTASRKLNSSNYNGYSKNDLKKTWETASKQSPTSLLSTDKNPFKSAKAAFEKNQGTIQSKTPELHIAEKKLSNIQKSKIKLQNIDDNIYENTIEVTDYQNKIKSYTKEAEQSSKFDLDPYKNIITEFLNKSIELSRVIIEINDNMEKGSKKDIFYFYYTEDKKLATIITDLQKNQKYYDRSSNIIKNIKGYILNIKTKDKNIINKTFFPKIMNELNNFKFDKEIKKYIDNLKDFHDELIEKITKKIDEVSENKTGLLENNSIKAKIKECMTNYDTEIKNLQKKYDKLITTGDKIYVYTYTDSIKFYFFILNMIYMILSNY